MKLKFSLFRQRTGNRKLPTELAFQSTAPPRFSANAKCSDVHSSQEILEDTVLLQRYVFDYLFMFRKENTNPEKLFYQLPATRNFSISASWCLRSNQMSRCLRQKHAAHTPDAELACVRARSAMCQPR